MGGGRPLLAKRRFRRSVPFWLGPSESAPARSAGGLNTNMSVDAALGRRGDATTPATFIQMAVPTRAGRSAHVPWIFLWAVRSAAHVRTVPAH